MERYRLRKASTTAAAALVAGLIAGPITETGQAAAAGWKKVIEREGIVVHARASAGRSMPVFRAYAEIDARPTEILAVLQDAPTQHQWRPRCVVTRIIEQVTPTERYVYSRSDAPWPVADRDVVVRTAFRILAPDRHIENEFEAAEHPEVPPVAGVVRIRRLKGHYKLVAIGDDRTGVEYEIDSDPGGNIPYWLAEKESRAIPLETLRNLRTQVERTRGEYAAFVARWSSVKAGVGTH